MEEVDELIYTAKLMEQSERYDEMADCMKKVVEIKQQLSIEERNLLSVAFKNYVGSRRAAWRVVSSQEGKYLAKESKMESKLATKCRLKIEAELQTICNDILNILDRYLIQSAPNAESKVFYYKMKGDYYRYISEFCTEEQKKEPTETARAAYLEATRIANNELSPTHPIRLGLALNFSVFYYEIVNESAEACALARQAFEDAIADLDCVSEDSYRDSTLIMQLLRDNLTLWTSESSDKEKDAAETAGAK